MRPCLQDTLKNAESNIVVDRADNNAVAWQKRQRWGEGELGNDGGIWERESAQNKNPPK
jgi:hypothetical protein